MVIFDTNVEIGGVSRLKNNAAQYGGEFTREYILLGHNVILYKGLVRETVEFKGDQQ